MDAHAKPTESELAILNVLWQRGPSTVREVMEVLSEEKSTGYNTVLKFLLIMADKGLVVRDESRRSHVYEAAVCATTTQGHLIRDLADRAFQGSAQRLIMQALNHNKIKSQELEEIRGLIDKMESGTP